MASEDGRPQGIWLTVLQFIYGVLD
jgi:hypothetical protein